MKKTLNLINIWLLITCTVSLSAQAATDNITTSKLQTSSTAASLQQDAHTTHAQPLSPKQTAIYVCPMHAHIVSETPSTCPICSMQLVQVSLKTETELTDSQQGDIPPAIRINVSGNMQQALALKVVTAKYESLSRFVETVGKIDYDESQITHIHARVTGWIEKLMLQSAGDVIKKNQLLYEIYSPDLINAQNDYLLALDTASAASQPRRYQDLVRKAGLRLSLLGFNNKQIEQLKQSRQTEYRVPFYATMDGIAQNLNVRDGMYIQPETEIMSVVNLRHVWLIADVFENEQSWIALGQQAEITVPAMNISGLKGTVDYIYPELDPVTHSLRVRIVLTSQDTLLRPNTLAKVALFGNPKKNTLVIPQEALIQTGQENRVIIKLADDSFSARAVTIGMMSQGKAEILSGLSAGEQVVTSGQFLLDSEASLKGSLMRLSSGHQH